jgi:hypothetical protein
MEYHRNEVKPSGASPDYTRDSKGVLVTNLLCFSTILLILLFLSFGAYGFGLFDVVALESGLSITGEDLLGYIFATDLFLIVAICFIITNERLQKKIKRLFIIKNIDVTPYKSQNKDQMHINER